MREWVRSLGILQKQRIWHSLGALRHANCGWFSADTTLSLEEKISSFEKILLRDLKLMRHRQVIHPVLQEGRILQWASPLAQPLPKPRKCNLVRKKHSQFQPVQGCFISASFI